MHYTALAAGATAYWRFLESRNVDPRPVFESAGLDPAALGDHNARYPESGYYRLVKAAVAATGDALIGLHIAEHWHPSMAHALGYAWLASDSLRDGLGRVARYYRIATDRDVVEFERLGEQCELRLHTPDPAAPVAPEDLDAFFAIVVYLCRESAGPGFAPRRVQMQRARPANTAAYTEYFRAPVQFGANRNAMLVDTAAIDVPLPTANADVARASDGVIVEYLARHGDANVSLRVRERLTELLPSGRAAQGGVARALHMSTRTLQRRLGEEGTTFRDLVEQTRRELAFCYLRDSSLSINEVTYLLGFSEPANFTRAFRRWAGTSPTRYRAERLEEQR